MEPRDSLSLKCLTWSISSRPTSTNRKGRKTILELFSCYVLPTCSCNTQDFIHYVKVTHGKLAAGAVWFLNKNCLTYKSISKHLILKIRLADNGNYLYIRIYVNEGDLPPQREFIYKKCALILTYLNFSHLQSTLHLMQHTY